MTSYIAPILFILFVLLVFFVLFLISGFLVKLIGMTSIVPKAILTLILYLLIGLLFLGTFASYFGDPFMTFMLWPQILFYIVICGLGQLGLHSLCYH